LSGAATPPADPVANGLIPTERPNSKSDPSEVRATNSELAAGGKTAVYMLRWVNTRGEKGPWSEVAAATVAVAVAA